MSPRSDEYMQMAHDALEAARSLTEAGLPADAVSRAYYAMLDAARAALSERDLHAKTHGGTWSLFAEQFIKTGRIDDVWSRRAGRVRQLREAGDYDAERPDAESAAEALAQAEEFVQLIDALLE